jgi:hypothetical protein
MFIINTPTNARKIPKPFALDILSLRNRYEIKAIKTGVRLIIIPDSIPEVYLRP